MNTDKTRPGRGGPRSIAALVVAFGLVVCGCSPSTTPPVGGGAPLKTGFSTVASEDDAIRLFYAVRGSVGLAPAPQERVTARRNTLKECLARVKDTLTPQEMKSCIVSGDLSALDREGDCWVVEVDQGLLGAQFAYFDDAGALVLAWRAPEG